MYTPILYNKGEGKFQIISSNIRIMIHTNKQKLKLKK